MAVIFNVAGTLPKIKRPKKKIGGYSDWKKAKNLKEIIDLSKKDKKALFFVTDRNYSLIGYFYLKNGKFAKATTANPNYDFQNNKARLRDRNDVLYKYKVLK